MFYLYINLSIHYLVNMLWLLRITIHEVYYIYIHFLNMSLTHVYIQIYLSTYLVYLSFYPPIYFYRSVFISIEYLCLYAYEIKSLYHMHI